MSQYELPPIVRLAERLVVMVEEAVRRFARYHEYTFGTELRQQAHAVLRLCHRAWRDKEAQDFWLDQLMWSVDEFKLSLQLGQHLQAYAGFAQFEALARHTAELGRQCGGWRKQHRAHGQKPPSGETAARSPILSTRAAPNGAQP